MKRGPSDKAMKAARTRHARRAIRETLAYRLGWPEKSDALLFAWQGCVIMPSSGVNSVSIPRKPHWKDYLRLLKSDLPILV
jgi:hypothetical protein